MLIVCQADAEGNFRDPSCGDYLAIYIKVLVKILVILYLVAVHQLQHPITGVLGERLT